MEEKPETVKAVCAEREADDAVCAEREADDAVCAEREADDAVCAEREADDAVCAEREADDVETARQYAIAFVWALAGLGLGLGVVRLMMKIYTSQPIVVQLLLGLLPFQVTAPLAAILGLRRLAVRKGWRRTMEWDDPLSNGRQSFRTHAILLMVCVFSSFIINSVSQAICEKLGIPFPEQSLIKMAHGNSDVLFWGIAFFSVMVLAPCVEEFLYRLILFEALNGALGKKTWAAVLTALCFAMAHGIMPMVPALFVLGMLFQEAKGRGGLRQSILLHSCYNGLMLLLVLIFD